MSTNITELIEWLETKCEIKLDPWQQTVLLEYFVVERGEAVEVTKPFTIASSDQVEAGRRKGANPSTCRHDVVNRNRRCVSCGRYVTLEMWNEKNYQYNLVFDCYEHKRNVSPKEWTHFCRSFNDVETRTDSGCPGCGMERPQARTSTDI